MASDQTFDSQDELITQADQRLQWDKLTIEAMQHQILFSTYLSFSFFLTDLFSGDCIFMYFSTKMLVCQPFVD